MHTDTNLKYVIDWDTNCETNENETMLLSKNHDRTYELVFYFSQIDTSILTWAAFCK